MRSFDLFVLLRSQRASQHDSRSDGHGLPVSPRVGGNRELVREGQTDACAAGDPESMALALRLCGELRAVQEPGKEARRTIENEFGMEAMVNGYIKIYDTWLAKNARRKGS